MPPRVKSQPQNYYNTISLTLAMMERGIKNAYGVFETNIPIPTPPIYDIPREEGVSVPPPRKISKVIRLKDLFAALDKKWDADKFPIQVNNSGRTGIELIRFNSKEYGAINSNWKLYQSVIEVKDVLENGDVVFVLNGDQKRALEGEEREIIISANLVASALGVQRGNLVINEESSGGEKSTSKMSIGKRGYNPNPKEMPPGDDIISATSIAEILIILRRILPDESDLPLPMTILADLLGDDFLELTGRRWQVTTEEDGKTVLLKKRKETKKSEETKDENYVEINDIATIDEFNNKPAGAIMGMHPEKGGRGIHLGRRAAFSNQDNREMDFPTIGPRPDWVIQLKGRINRRDSIGEYGFNFLESQEMGGAHALRNRGMNKVMELSAVSTGNAKTQQGVTVLDAYPDTKSARTRVVSMNSVIEVIDGMAGDVPGADTGPILAEDENGEMEMWDAEKVLKAVGLIVEKPPMAMMPGQPATPPTKDEDAAEIKMSGKKAISFLSARMIGLPPAVSRIIWRRINAAFERRWNDHETADRVHVMFGDVDILSHKPSVAALGGEPVMLLDFYPAPGRTEFDVAVAPPALLPKEGETEEDVAQRTSDFQTENQKFYLSQNSIGGRVTKEYVIVDYTMQRPGTIATNPENKRYRVYTIQLNDAAALSYADDNQMEWLSEKEIFVRVNYGGFTPTSRSEVRTAWTKSIGQSDPRRVSVPMTILTGSVIRSQLPPGTTIRAVVINTPKGPIKGFEINMVNVNDFGDVSASEVSRILQTGKIIEEIAQTPKVEEIVNDWEKRIAEIFEGQKEGMQRARLEIGGANHGTIMIKRIFQEGEFRVEVIGGKSALREGRTDLERQKLSIAYDQLIKITANNPMVVRDFVHTIMTMFSTYLKEAVIHLDVDVPDAPTEPTTEIPQPVNPPLPTEEDVKKNFGAMGVFAEHASQTGRFLTEQLQADVIAAEAEIEILTQDEKTNLINNATTKLFSVVEDSKSEIKPHFRLPTNPKARFAILDDDTPLTDMEKKLMTEALYGRSDRRDAAVMLLRTKSEAAKRARESGKVLWYNFGYGPDTDSKTPPKDS